MQSDYLKEMPGRDAGDADAYARNVKKAGDARVHGMQGSTGW